MKAHFKTLDAEFSRYIRRRDSVNGMVRCFTCGRHLPFNQMENGHFVKRSKMATRYNERNCAAQCFECNHIKNGNLKEFAKRLDLKYGEGTAEKLIIEGNKIRKFTLEDIKELKKWIRQ